MGLLNSLFGKRKNSIDIESLNRDLQILNDCADILEKTVVPDTFFERYDLYMEKLIILANAENEKKVKVTGESIAKKHQELSTEEKIVSFINNFIDRMWTDTCEKAEKLKTEKGKQSRYDKFYSSLSEYESKMPKQCIVYYKSLNRSNVEKSRKLIFADKIDQMQRIEASDTYKNKIYQKFYFDYPEKPYISKDREMNTNWLEQAEAFPLQCIISKLIMQRYEDGLLPGHVYMLYWLKRYTNKRIPVYFEYKYGIDFEKEKTFLLENGFLDNVNKPTKKGENAIKEHYDIIESHISLKQDRTIDGISKQIIEQRDSMIKNGFKEYKFHANMNSNPCSVCTALNGKHFHVSEFKIGVNAPPMHEGCKCSISAYEDSTDYEGWLDFLSKGGSTEEWKKKH